MLWEFCGSCRSNQVNPNRSEMERVRRRANSEIFTSTDEHRDTVENGSRSSVRRTRSKRGPDGFLIPKSRASGSGNELSKQKDEPTDHSDEETTEVWEEIKVFCSFKGGSQLLQVFPQPQDSSVLPITSRLRQNFKKARPDYVENSECDEDEDEEDDDEDGERIENQYDFKCCTCSRRFKDALTLRAHSTIHLFERRALTTVLSETVETKVSTIGSSTKLEPVTPVFNSNEETKRPSDLHLSDHPPIVRTVSPEVSRFPITILKTSAVSTTLPTFNSNLSKIESNRFKCLNCGAYKSLSELASHKPCPVRKALPELTKASKQDPQRFPEGLAVKDKSNNYEEDVITLSD